MELVFDMTIEKAKYCVDCQTLTNSADGCRRCGGKLITMLSRFMLKPLEIVKPKSGFIIKRGVEYDDGFGMEDVDEFPSSHDDSGSALRLLKRHVLDRGHALGALQEGMFTRLPQAISVWQEYLTDRTTKNFDVWIIVRLGEINVSKSA